MPETQQKHRKKKRRRKRRSSSKRNLRPNAMFVGMAVVLAGLVAMTALRGDGSERRELVNELEYEGGYETGGSRLDTAASRELYPDDPVAALPEFDATLGSLYRGRRTSEWLVAIEDPDDEVSRAKGAHALGVIGVETDSVVPALVGALDDPDERVRIVTCEALDALLAGQPVPDPEGDPESEAPAILAGLLRALDDTALEVRLAAGRGIEQVGPLGAPAVQSLIDWLESDEEEAWLQAAVNVKAIGPEAREAVPALVQLLALDQRKLHAALVDALGAIGPDALPAAGPLLETVAITAKKRRPTLEVVTRFGPDVIPVVLTCAQNPDHEVRGTSVVALGMIAQNLVYPSSIDEIGERDPEAMQQALATLLDALQTALADERTGIRIAAAESIGVLREGAEPAISALTAALIDPEISVRRSICEAFARMGPTAEPAIPGIMAAFYDDLENGQMYMDAMFGIGDAAQPVLTEATRDRDEDVQAFAVATLIKMRDHR